MTEATVCPSLVLFDLPPAKSGKVEKAAVHDNKNLPACHCPLDLSLKARSDNQTECFKHNPRPESTTSILNFLGNLPLFDRIDKSLTHLHRTKQVSFSTAPNNIMPQSTVSYGFSERKPPLKRELGKPFRNARLFTTETSGCADQIRKGNNNGQQSLGNLKPSIELSDIYCDSEDSSSSTTDISLPSLPIIPRLHGEHRGRRAEDRAYRDLSRTSCKTPQKSPQNPYVVLDKKTVADNSVGADNTDDDEMDLLSVINCEFPAMETRAFGSTEPTSIKPNTTVQRRLDKGVDKKLLMSSNKLSESNIIKLELQLMIQYRRLANGQPELFPEPQTPKTHEGTSLNSELTEEERKKREQRRLHNRKSAEKMKRLHKLKEISLRNEIKHLVNANAEILVNLSKLRKEKATLKKALDAHVKSPNGSCKYQIPADSSTDIPASDI